MKVRLVVVEGPDRGREFTFETRDRFLIGRVPTAHFQITQDPFFSRVHAMLEVDPPNVMVQDKASIPMVFMLVSLSENHLISTTDSQSIAP